MNAQETDSYDPPLGDHIARRILECGYPQLRHVEVNIRRGTVSLRGIVPTYYLKQLAQAAVMTVDGVESVANELIVS